MVVLRGPRENVGSTQEELDPMGAEVADALSRPVPIEVETTTEAPVKQSAVDVGYREGSYPYVCGTCKSFVGDGEEGECQLVDGPYDGLVDADDTCELWRPGQGLMGRSDEEED